MAACAVAIPVLDVAILRGGNAPCAAIALALSLTVYRGVEMMQILGSKEAWKGAYSRT